MVIAHGNVQLALENGWDLSDVLKICIVGDCLMLLEDSSISLGPKWKFGLVGMIGLCVKHMPLTNVTLVR